MSGQRFQRIQVCCRPCWVRACALAITRHRIDWLAAWLSVHDQLGSTAGIDLSALREVEGTDANRRLVTTTARFEQHVHRAFKMRGRGAAFVPGQPVVRTSTHSDDRIELPRIRTCATVPAGL